jgi:DNA-binding HxlR family transcriptional regulator
MSKRSNPETSNAAFRSLKHSEVKELHEKIIWGLGQIKEGTFEDISLAIKISKDRVWRRLSELIRDGKIYRPGTKKVLSSGREGYTYRLTTPGQSIEPVTEKFPAGPSSSDYAKNIIQQSMF